MANNRLYLTCRICKDSFMLAKFYPSIGWFTYEEKKQLQRLNRWFDKHIHSEEKESDLWGKWQWGISYEVTKREVKTNGKTN